MVAVTGHHHHVARQPATHRRVTLMLLIPAALLTLAGMVALWPHDAPKAAPDGGPPRSLGQVVAVTQQTCPRGQQGRGSAVRCRQAAPLRLGIGPARLRPGGQHRHSFRPRRARSA
jgi:hypothetical protein